LFATHYFELTELAGEYAGIANVHLDAVELHHQERDDDLVFLHALKDGPASRSFGLQVAALAGLPPAVIAAARETLATLEQGMHDAPRAAAAPATPQRDLFAAPAPDPRA